MEADPLGLAAGNNLYGYVEGNPLSYVDPWGLAASEEEIAPEGPLQDIINAQVQELIQQIHQYNPNFTMMAEPNSPYTQQDVNYLEQTLKARQRYPNEPRRMERHHLIPRYLGGARNGLICPLDAAYHESITQGIRQQYKFGGQRPPMDELQQFLKSFYGSNPLPTSVMDQFLK